MSLACAVLVARLCVPADYAPTVQHTGGMVEVVYPDPSKAPREMHGVMITAIGKDYFTPVPARAFDQACEKDRCVYYIKHCEARPLVCEYVYAMPNLYGGSAPTSGDRMTLDFEQFRISARSTAALRRAEAAIGLKLAEDIRIPIARLVAERPSVEVPNCGIDPEPGCPDDPRMARARAEREAYRARRAAQTRQGEGGD